MRTFRTVEELDAAIGTEVGVSPWVLIDQARVDAFADATGDHQWIHTDVERAAAGPYGGTIAHGYLTLAMLPGLANATYRIEAGRARLNYGLERVRFPAPVPVGSRIRARIEFRALEPVPTGHRLVIGWTVEVEQGARPACVAESIVLLT